MKILLYGAGRIGTRVLVQLQKSPALEVVVVDPRGDDCEAVERGVIKKVQREETLTPLNFDGIVAELQPDLILLATASEELGLGNSPGVDTFADAMRDEFEAASKVPVLEIARRMGAVRVPTRQTPNG